MIRKQDSGSINWGFRGILGFPPPETTGVQASRDNWHISKMSHASEEEQYKVETVAIG